MLIFNLFLCSLIDFYAINTYIQSLMLILHLFARIVFIYGSVFIPKVWKNRPYRYQLTIGHTLIWDMNLHICIQQQNVQIWKPCLKVRFVWFLFSKTNRQSPWNEDFQIKQIWSLDWNMIFHFIQVLICFSCLELSITSVDEPDYCMRHARNMESIIYQMLKDGSWTLPKQCFFHSLSFLT